MEYLQLVNSGGRTCTHNSVEISRQMESGRDDMAFDYHHSGYEVPYISKAAG
jgi:hypothetical protein